MTPPSEISVERQFRFRCSCGATTESGEKEVICSGCGAALGIRRVRRHRQQRWDAVAYYGSRTVSVRRVERHVSRLSEWVKSALGSSVGTHVRHTNPVPHSEAQKVLRVVPFELQVLRVLHDEVHGTKESPRRLPLLVGAHVKVGPTRPDGKLHPHAGKTGKITKFSYAYPDWDVPPCAAIKLDSWIGRRRFIWVSLQCLEALPEDARNADL